GRVVVGLSGHETGIAQRITGVIRTLDQESAGDRPSVERQLRRPGSRLEYPQFRSGFEDLERRLIERLRDHDLEEKLDDAPGNGCIDRAVEGDDATKRRPAVAGQRSVE